MQKKKQKIKEIFHLADPRTLWNKAEEINLQVHISRFVTLQHKTHQYSGHDARGTVSR